MSQRVLWMFNHYAQMPDGSGGTRHFSLAKQLAAHGWRVIVVAASTELHTGTQRSTNSETHTLEPVDGVDFLWLKTPNYSGNGIGRLLNMWAFYRHASARRTKLMLPAPDVVLGSSPHPLAAYAAYKMAQRFSVPFVYEVRDLWPESLVELGKISKWHPLTLGFGWIEKTLSRAAARIITIPPLVKTYFQPRGVPQERILWLPNGIDTQLSPEQSPKDDTDVFSYMYFGAHGNGNALDNLIRAMHVLSQRPDAAEIQLRLIGSGPLKNELVALAESLALKNVIFENPVPKRDIPALAAQADAFVFNVMDAPVLTKYGISPNKLFDFLAAGRPLIFASSSVNNPVAEAEAGLSVPAGNPEALADAMMQLANLPLAERQAMGRRGRAFVEANHSFTSLAAKLADMLNAIAKPKG